MLELLFSERVGGQKDQNQIIVVMKRTRAASRSSCLLGTLLALICAIQALGVQALPEQQLPVILEDEGNRAPSRSNNYTADSHTQDLTFYSECTLKHVENLCTRNITMASGDGSRVKAPGVSIWIQAHCGNESDEHKRAMCVLSYIGDDFGEDQANEFFSCVCDECPRACQRKGNLRNRQNVIAGAATTVTTSQ